MTRFIYDQFSKDCLETLLTPYGKVEVAKKIAGEIKEIDLYFLPNSANLPSNLGILAQLATTPSLFEPYRNPVTPKEIKDCILKLLEINTQIYREGNRNKIRLSESDLPTLWIITPTASRRILSQFGAQLQSIPGIYHLPESLRTAIVVIHKLAVTRDTLWLRLLGRGKVQKRAMDEFIELPNNYAVKSAILEILYGLEKNLEINKEITQREDRELMMRLAALYQEEKTRVREEGYQIGKAEGKAEGKVEGEVNLILRQLSRKLGDLSPELTSQVRQLNLAQLEILGEMLLEFDNQQDLVNWLRG